MLFVATLCGRYLVMAEKNGIRWAAFVVSRQHQLGEEERFGMSTGVRVSDLSCCFVWVGVVF